MCSLCISRHCLNVRSQVTARTSTSAATVELRVTNVTGRRTTSGQLDRAEGLGNPRTTMKMRHISSEITWIVIRVSYIETALSDRCIVESHMTLPSKTPSYFRSVLA